MTPKDPLVAPVLGSEIRSVVDSEGAEVNRRFRVLFTLGAAALVAINAAVGLVAYFEQRQMSAAALDMFDHAFLSAAQIAKANVGFQRFLDERTSTVGDPNFAFVTGLLDPVAEALDAAADSAPDPTTKRQRLDLRTSVLAYEAAFFDKGPKLRARIMETQAQLDRLAAQAIEQGRRARDLIQAASDKSIGLLFGSVTAGLSLGLITMMVLRRTIAFSTVSRITRMANYDAVTGLPNRRMLRRRLAEGLAERGDGRGAVLTLDLDRFKGVNDTLGHKTGDQVLAEVAQRIRLLIGPDDMAARYGGDEFVVFLSGVVEPSQAAALANRLVRRLAEPYEVDGQRALIGVSVGIALAPDHGGDVDVLLRNSDLALYLAKQEGKGQYRFFAEGLNASVQARRLMEIDLREAVQAGAIDVHFQPVIDVVTDRIVACEALARWDRPGFGPVPPAEFVPLAEESGLISELGAGVLRKACAQAAGWDEPIRVAVNLSVRQFQCDDLVELVTRVLAETGLAPSRLELEVTESILISDKERVVRTLTALRDLGVQIALDDFGTGYSSLSYLSSFPFDRLKIDRSFVSGLSSRKDAAAIVRAVTSLAAALGMATTAEGVETAQDFDWLRRNGCDHAQGYLFSAPIPPAEFADFVHAHGPVKALGPVEAHGPAKALGPVEALGPAKRAAAA